MITAIRVTYHLAADEGVDRSAVDRALASHAEHCPVARSVGGSIDISTELAYV